MDEVKNPHSINAEDVVRRLDVSRSEGLDEREAAIRLQTYGQNRLKESKPVSAWIILYNQFKSLIILLLVAAAVLSYAFGDWLEGTAIVIVIIINTAIGFFTEIKAVRSMEALNKLVRVDAMVRRSGSVQKIPTEDIVPGDILILEAGDMIPADGRLIKASKMESDESSLTGESVPVPKHIESIEQDAELAERGNMVFMGTALTRGTGEAVVTSTGLSTELGHISTLVESAADEQTPLEKSLDRLGNRLIWVTLVLAAIVIGAGVLGGRGLLLMVETGIALAVAAIPEGLPIVATIALARGMLRMARRNALVNKLSAVETLGSTNLICTDKTGTLTENKMTVEMISTADGTVEVTGGDAPGEGEFLLDGGKIDPNEDSILRRVIEVGVLCNRASLNRETSGKAQNIGDPLEIALLLVGEKAGIRREELLIRYPETGIEAFDTSVNMMATFHERDGSERLAVKGAPYAVLEASASILTREGDKQLTGEMKNRWIEKNDELCAMGYRVIAHAEKTVQDAEADPYQNLTFLGLVCLLDPPRPDVRDAIERCMQAGIRVVMVTGDHPATASNIAHAVGLVESADTPAVHGKTLGDIDELSEENRRDISESSILARVSPEQKLDVIALNQENGLVVAMTGDGVNDAPALKQADIGIAMGLRGTQVAREASDIVLKDDSFSTIVHAIEQGRIIFGNIRKFIFYLISCNVSEIMIVTIASFVSIPLPILPLQILFLNLVTDVFPALALGMGEGDEKIMKTPPRDPKEPIITNRNWLAIGAYGILITASVLGALVIAITELGFSDERAVSVSFLTLAFAQLFHVFNMRDKGSGFIKNDVTRNKFVWGAILLCAAIILIAVYVTPLADVLKVLNPGPEGWALITVMSLVPLALGQIIKVLR